MKEKQQNLIDAITTGQDFSTIHDLIAAFNSSELHFTDNDTTVLAEAARYGNDRIVADLMAHTTWTPAEAQGAINTAIQTMDFEEIDPAQYRQTLDLLRGLILQPHHNHGTAAIETC